MARERLELDLGPALNALKSLDDALRKSSIDFSQALNKAVSQISAVTLKGDAKPITTAINKAVDTADATVDLKIDSAPIAAVDGPLRNARGQFVGLGTDAEDSGKKIKGATGHAKDFGGQLGDLKKQIAQLGVVLGVLQVVKFFASAVSAASDLNETMSKSAAVFQDSAGFVEDFGDSAAKAFGLSKQGAIESAATIGNLLTSLGLSRSASAGMSVELVKLAADLGSFNNIPIDDALERLRSGLVGEVEPLRRMGIALNAGTVEAKALQLGLVGANGEVSEAAKVQARYALILEMSSNAQGDFARTADGLANTQKILAAQFSDLKVRVGNELLPSVLALAHGVSDDLLPPIGEFLIQGGRVANQMLPLFGSNAQALTGILGILATVLAAMPDQLLQGAVAGATLAKVLGEDASRGAKGAAVAIGLLLPLLGELDAEAQQVATSMATFAAIGFRVAGPWGAAIGAIVGAAAGLAGLNETAGLTAEAMKRLGTQSDLALGRIADGYAKLVKAGVVPATRALEQLREVAESNTATATRFGNALVDAGVVKAGQVEKVIRQVVLGQQQLALDVAASSDALEDQSAALEAAEETYAEYLKELKGGLPTILGVFDEAAKGIDKFSDAGSPKKLLANLTGQLTAVHDFNVRLQQLIDEGLIDLAALVASKGPLAGAALAEALANADPEVRRGLNTAVGGIPGVLDETSRVIAGAGPALAASAYGAFAGITPEVEKALGLVKEAVGRSALSIGLALMGGIELGILSKQDELLFLSGQVAAAIEARMRQEAESHSPSMVFARIGADMMGGLALGLRSAAAQPIATAGAVAQAMALNVNVRLQGDGAGNPAVLAGITGAVERGVGSLLRDVVVSAGTG